MAPEPRGDGGRGRGLWRKDPSPCDPLQKRGGIPNFNTVAALRFPAPFRGRQSRRFLETGSLHPPLAALRLFPPHPLETTRPGGLRAPYSGLHPQNGSGSGKRSRTHTSTSPESRTQGPKCGEHVLCSGAVRRTRRKPSRFLPHGFARPPHLSKKGAKGAGFAPKRLFLPPCTAHSFSARRKRMGGAKPAIFIATPGTRAGAKP